MIKSMVRAVIAIKSNARETLLRLKDGFGGGKATEKPKAKGLGAGRDEAFPAVLLPRFRPGPLKSVPLPTGTSIPRAPALPSIPTIPKSKP